MKWITNVDSSNKIYLKDVVLGDPRPSENISVDELKKMGFIGVYRSGVKG